MARGRKRGGAARGARGRPRKHPPKTANEEESGDSQEKDGNDNSHVEDTDNKSVIVLKTLHKKFDKLRTTDSLLEPNLLTDESKASDDNSNSTDKCEDDLAKPNAEDDIAQDTDNNTEETAIVFEILEDYDDDSNNDPTTLVPVEELACQDHPDVVSYEVEIGGVGDKMVVDSSDDQQECNVQCDSGDMEYSYGSAKEETVETENHRLFEMFTSNCNELPKILHEKDNFIVEQNNEKCEDESASTRLDEYENSNSNTNSLERNEDINKALKSDSESTMSSNDSTKNVPLNTLLVVDTDNSASEQIDNAALQEVEENSSKGVEKQETSESSAEQEPNIDETMEKSSPLIRRSNRIKTISVLKKKSKGRGLVRSNKLKKPDTPVNLDNSDLNITDDISNSNSSMTNEQNLPEDNSKPVAIKVKSRWRRTSELEMGGPIPSAPSGDNNTQQVKLEDEDTKIKTSEEIQSEKDMEERLKQFVHLHENEYRFEKYVCREAKKMTCDCFLTEEEIDRGELGCGEDCINRLLMIECGPNCVVGDRCTNRRFQQSQYATCKVFKTEKKGFGIQATMDLFPGDFIMEYVGEVLNTEQFEQRVEEYSNDKNRHYYFMALKSDAIIDATRKGNVSRFINHSCDPNAETQKWTVNGELRIGFFSKREIMKGDEITFDYQFQRYGKEAQQCFCEAPNCRGWIGEKPGESADEGSETESESENEAATTSTSKVSDTQDEVKTEDDKKLIKPKTKKLMKSSADSDDDDWTKIVKNEDMEEERQEIQKEKKKIRKQRTKKIKKCMVPRKDKLEDLDLDEEIQKLSKTGLKNQAHTLTLSRLMVRAKEIEHRSQLLSLIQEGEVPCRRLFLDYHGLRLIYSWMCDSTVDKKILNENKKSESEFLSLRLKILHTLGTLPIPNKTMLQDSKVLPTVEKWSQNQDESQKSPNSSPSDDSEASSTPILIDEATGLIIEPVKKDLSEEEKPTKKEVDAENKLSANFENNENISNQSVKTESSLEEGKKQPDADDSSISTEISTKSDQDALYIKCISDVKVKIIQVSKTLLGSWQALKEVFRIPKRERIEQMKEHEREANRGYTDPSSESKEVKHNRFKAVPKENVINTISGAASGLVRSVIKKMDRSSASLSKYQRRQQFAERVAAEEIEKRLRAGRELWRAHSNHCSLMGYDPLSTPAPDPATGRPMFYDPVKEEWNIKKMDHVGMPPIGPLMPPQPNMMMYPNNQPGFYPHPGMLISPKPFAQQQMILYPPFQNNMGVPPMIAPPDGPPQMMTPVPQQQIQLMPHGGQPVIIPPGQQHMLVPGSMIPNQQHMMMTGQSPMLPPGQQHMMQQSIMAPNQSQMIAPYQQPKVPMTPEQQKMFSMMIAQNMPIPVPLPGPKADPMPVENQSPDKDKSHRKKSKKKDKKRKDKEPTPTEQDADNFNMDNANPYKIPPPEHLPPGWLSAIDQNGRIYYYHTRRRVSQWLPPDMCKNIFGRFNQFHDSDSSDDDESVLQNESQKVKDLYLDDSDDSDSDAVEDTLLMRQVHGNILSKEKPSFLNIKKQKNKHIRSQKNRVTVLKAEAESTTSSDDLSSFLEAFPKRLSKPTLNSPVYIPKRVRELQPVATTTAVEALESPVVNSDSSQIGDITPQPEDTMNFGEESGIGCDSSSLLSKDKNKNKREGLVTEILISPRSEHDRLYQKMEIKRYKENKEKLKLKKYVKIQNQIMKVKGIETLNRKPTIAAMLKPVAPVPDLSVDSGIASVVPEPKIDEQLLGVKRKSSNHDHYQKRLKVDPERYKVLEQNREDIPFLYSLSENSKEGVRIKEQFRVDVAKVIVSQLNHFRKPDCLIGRITNTKDFKHLAKKLTHFVMVKELKHCKSVEELTFNESVKIKAKEFVKKYMVKYGDTYVRPPQEVD